ncbi:MAG: hypothetical protein WCK39_04150, partial [Methanomassiliicoccales archaeon]
MRKRTLLLTTLVAMMMLSGPFLTLTPTVVAKSTSFVDPEPIDLGYKIRDENFDSSLLSQNGRTQDQAVPGDYWVIGNVALYCTGSMGKTEWMYFTMRLIGEHCEVWTANDMTFPSGDPRNAYTSRLTITDAQAQHMADEFDHNIYPIETAYFSAAPPLDGNNSALESRHFSESYLFRTHEPGKVMILVLNIVDHNFYDPNYPTYIGGYFSPWADSTYARNIIHIDCWDWTNSTGGVYGSVVAHEYQHLLHNYLKPLDPLWLNEGFSMYTQMLCGYGAPRSHIACYLFSPDNSLTVWADQGNINILADYGAAALFMIYVNDHFGGPAFFSDFMHSPITDTAGITATLHQEGYWQWTYDLVFKAFRLANLIRADTPGNGLYNYRSINLDEIQGLTVHQYPSDAGLVTRSQFLGPTITLWGDDTGVSTVSAYSTDYYRISGFDALNKFTNRLFFTGDDKVYYGNWNLIDLDGTDFWYSGTGVNMADQKLIAPIRAGEGTSFAFDTAWSLEQSFDFGFVQISTDQGSSWTSMPYEYTTRNASTADTISTVVDNLPGVT